MSNDVAASAVPDNPFEAPARALSEFFIRAVILPVTLLFTKPRAIAEAAAGGAYRPLPSPFLLALITGVLVSGVTSNLDKLSPFQSAEQKTKSFAAIAAFYTETDGVKAVLLAVPYMAVVWIAAALVSAAMLRGVRDVAPLFAGLSLCLSAIIEVAAVGTAIALVMPTGSYSMQGWVGFGFGLFTLVLAVKFIRLVFILRNDRGSPLFGAILAAVPALLVIGVSGAMAGAVFVQSLHYAAPTDDGEEARAAMARGDYAAAMASYDKALQRKWDDPYAFAGRAQIFHMQGDLVRARAEYDRAVAALPIVLFTDARAALAVEQGDYAAAIADYDKIIALQPVNLGAYNDRCWARAVWGQELDRALSDCNESLRLNETLRFGEESFNDRDKRANVLDSRGLVRLRQGDFVEAAEDFRASAELAEGLAAGVRSGEIQSFWKLDAAALDRHRAHALYGAGLAQHRSGNASGGQAQMSAATALDSTVAETYRRYGLSLDAPREGALQNARPKAEPRPPPQ